MAFVYTTQNFGETDTVAGVSRQLGTEFATDQTGKQAERIRVWIPSTYPTGMRATFWQAPSTLLQNILLDSESPVAGGWHIVTGFTPHTLIQNQHYFVTEWIPGDFLGSYNFQTNGPVTPQFSGTAVSIFDNAIDADDPPTNNTLDFLLFGADVDVTDAPTNLTLPLDLITEAGTVQSLTFHKTLPLTQITETGTPQTLTLSQHKTLPLAQITETGTPLALAFTGGAAPVAGGWMPKVNRHCIYLEQKTVGGNTNYVKRRPAIITAVNGANVDLRIGRSGETHLNVAPRVNPEDVGVYIAY